MMQGVEAGESPKAGEALRKAADALVRLVKEHLALARVEMKHDLRIAARDIALVLAGVPLMLIGWALLMGAGAAVLAMWVGWAGGLAIMGGLNFVAGALISVIFAKRLAAEDMPDLDETKKELQEDRRWLRMLRSRKVPA